MAFTWHYGAAKLGVIINIIYNSTAKPVERNKTTAHVYIRVRSRQNYAALEWSL
jgi:hypothetical protein